VQHRPARLEQAVHLLEGGREVPEVAENGSRDDRVEAAGDCLLRTLDAGALDQHERVLPFGQRAVGAQRATQPLPLRSGPALRERTVDAALLLGVADGREAVQADDLASAGADQAQRDAEGVPRPQLQNPGAVNPLRIEAPALIVGEDPVDAGQALLEAEASVAGAEQHRLRRPQPERDAKPEVAGHQRRDDQSAGAPGELA